LNATLDQRGEFQNAVAIESLTSKNRLETQSSQHNYKNDDKQHDFKTVFDQKTGLQHDIGPEHLIPTRYLTRTHEFKDDTSKRGGTPPKKKQKKQTRT